MKYRRYAELKKDLLGLDQREQYSLLLQTVEWKTFRDRVVERDNNKCTKCGKESCNDPYFDLTDEEWEILCDKADRESQVEWFLDFSKEEIPLKSRRHTPPSFGIRPLVQLDVHHKLYIIGYLPWEYNLKDLVIVSGMPSARACIYSTLYVCR